MRLIIGLSAGSSLDGVRAALVEVRGVGMSMRLVPTAYVHQEYPRDLRDLLCRLGAGDAGVRQASLAHRLLGEVFAAACHQATERARASLARVVCAGCSAYTACHESDGRFPSALGLGMTAIAAERTGLTVVSDFGDRDLAAGGQGLPLTPLVDLLLFHRAGEDRVLLHLDGLASAVLLPADGQPRKILAFHAAPCNVLLDGLIRRLTGGREWYDAGGKHAVQGRCLEPLLERWLAHPLLRRGLPRVLPRQAFGDAFVEQAVHQVRQTGGSLHDLLCTATHFVARGIKNALRLLLPQQPARIVLSGGGARNGFLWRLLEEQLAPLQLQQTDEHGIPAPARKAIASAGMAALTLDGVPSSLPAVTGAAGMRLLGRLTPGSPGNWAQCLAWMAAHNARPAQAA